MLDTSGQICDQPSLFDHTDTYEIYRRGGKVMDKTLTAPVNVGLAETP
jgi:hypothetical protein